MFLIRWILLGHDIHSGWAEPLTAALQFHGNVVLLVMLSGRQKTISNKVKS